jgi:hypothetical protein
MQIVGFPPPGRADWIFWRKMPHVEVWQAVALSMGLDPGKKHDDFVPIDEQEQEYDQRLLLVEAYIRRYELPVLAWPHRLHNGNMEFAVVDLRTFGTFLKRIEVPIPPEFPVDPVNWDKWSPRDKAKLWEACAIATGHSPDGAGVLQAKDSFGRAFTEMLEAALDCAGNSLPIHSYDQSEGSEGGPFGRPLGSSLQEVRTTVLLVRFREWAESKGYILPERFPRVAKQLAHPGNPLTSEQAPPSKWPWGTHETKLLIELSEAARHFWSEYQSGLPATAPTNDEVRAWLMRRGVPQRKAEVMAQILRADDLQPGPHVNK